MDETNSRENWRVFCAIDLPMGLKQSLATHTKRLREALPDAPASWSRPDSIHLTLKFFGEIERSRVQNISQRAARVAQSQPRFRISVGEAGVFPPVGKPRVLWIGVSDIEGQLAHLHASLEAEYGRAGFPKDARGFHPHLTLARLRKPEHARALASAHRQLEFQGEEFSASELLVIRSELGSEGSKYTVISRHSFTRTT